MMKQSLPFVVVYVIRFIFCQKCQFNVLDTSEYIGCFVDYKVDRLFPGLGGINHDTYMDNNKCILICRDMRYMFSGTQASDQCFCGDNPWRLQSQVTDEHCNAQCTGDGQQMCGAAWRMSVYRSGLMILTPQESSMLLKGKRYSKMAMDRKVHETNSIISSSYTSPLECARLCRNDGECTGFAVSMVTGSCVLYQLKFEYLCYLISVNGGGDVYMDEYSMYSVNSAPHDVSLVNS